MAEPFCPDQNDRPEKFPFLETFKKDGRSPNSLPSLQSIKKLLRISTTF
jgi:hypothetical protein